MSAPDYLTQSSRPEPHLLLMGKQFLAPTKARAVPIVCIGVSHHRAPVALREQLAFSSSDQHALYNRVNLGDLERRTGVGEIAILSTCNRVEVYAASRDPGYHFQRVPLELFRLLLNGRDVRPREVLADLYSYRGLDAVRHLCRVAAGLDSMVLGESEIMTQVRAAHVLAAEDRVLGPVLGEVFHAAIRSARLARAETGIARKAVSVSSEAIEVAAELAGPLAERRILIVGSGKVGRLSGRIFRAHGVGDLAVVSRTRAHAESLAREWNATALAWHELPAAIYRSDIVLTSTSAPHTVITTELVRSALGRQGRERPLLFLDIAVPRDVERGVRSLGNVRVVDIDEIKGRLHDNLADRKRAIADAEVILDAEIHRFEDWCHQAELRPLITAMRSRTEQIRRRELDRALRELGDVPPEVRSQLDRFSRSLVNKLLHEPNRRLKEETNPARRETYAEVTRALFDLPPDDGAQDNPIPEIRCGNDG